MFDFQIIIPDLRKYRQLVTDTTTKYPIMGQTQMTEFKNIVKNTSLQINCKVGDSLNLDNIGFIKIDVEGHEYEVLTGLSLLIQKNKPFIFIEIHSAEKTCNQTINLLYKFGYKKILKLSHCDYFVLP